MKMRLILGVFTMLMASCGIYSFTGADIHPDAKTISVTTFPNYAEIVNPNLSQTISEALKDYFLAQTSLDLATRNGDLQVQGSIVKYDLQPINIQSNETASQNRLTIVINVIFTNTIEPDKSYDATFRRFADFNSSTTFNSIEDELVEQINLELIEDIFNKAVVNW
jgi:hypothetical protein